MYLLFKMLNFDTVKNANLIWYFVLYDFNTLRAEMESHLEKQNTSLWKGKNEKLQTQCKSVTLRSHKDGSKQKFLKPVRFRETLFDT